MSKQPINNEFEEINDFRNNFPNPSVVLEYNYVKFILDNLVYKLRSVSIIFPLIDIKRYFF